MLLTGLREKKQADEFGEGERGSNISNSNNFPKICLHMRMRKELYIR